MAADIGRSAAIAPQGAQAESEHIVARPTRQRDRPRAHALRRRGPRALPSSRTAWRFYAAAERFLARHLGGRYEEDDTTTVTDA